MRRPTDTQGRVVVCALEGSGVDGNAVEMAAQLALLAGARVALLAVAPATVGGASGWGLPAWTLEEARDALALTAAALEGRVGVDCHLDSGNPVRRLVELAARKRALMLVVGTRSPLSAGPPSIVASGVARNAPCPVVVVPEGLRMPELIERQDGT